MNSILGETELEQLKKKRLEKKERKEGKRKEREKSMAGMGTAITQSSKLQASTPHQLYCLESLPQCGWLERVCWGCLSGEWNLASLA